MSSHGNNGNQSPILRENAVSMELVASHEWRPTMDTHDLENISLESNVPSKVILSIILFSNLWTLLLTVLPVVVEIQPKNYYAHHPDWYSGADIMRFIEPIGGLPLNVWILYKSGIFQAPLHKTKWIPLCIFFFGAAIYQQGAGFHSASAMFKNAVETLPAQDDQVNDLHYYMRTVWEHEVSHYLYATGLAIMHATQAYAYRYVVSPQLGLTKTSKTLLFCSSLLLGLLVAGVAIEFPSGTIVGLIYLVLYGLGCVGGYIFYQHYHYHDKTIFIYGHRPILHHFLLGYLWALTILIVWICVVGGFKSRAEAGTGI
jgi:hypothetical protein